MSIINSQPLIGASGNQATGYKIDRSLRFRNSASAHLTRTPASSGNQQKFTISTWVKRGDFSSADSTIISAGDSTNGFSLYLGANAGPVVYNRVSSSSKYTVSSQIWRDPSAWYHLILAVDTTQATAANRMIVYKNGVQDTTFATTDALCAQNSNLTFNINSQHRIGYTQQFSTYSDMYLSEFHFVDGQQLTPSSFGETDSVTGVWKPKAYSGTYGTNGFYLKFTDVATTSGSNAGLGKDFSGNGNYWTTNNISVTSGATYDSMKDVPTLTDTDTANYCVLNPLKSSLPGATLVNGNLGLTCTSATDNNIQASIYITSGKWYYETGITAVSGTNYLYTGWIKFPGTVKPADFYQWGSDGVKEVVVNGSSTRTSAATFANGDIVGLAFDADAGTITAYKNGTSLGVYFSGITVDAPMTVSTYVYNNSCFVNFGQRPFAYTPPTGYKALNTYNLPDSTIVAGNKVMDATTYAGAGGTTSFTNTGGFKPDLIWIKSRTDGGSHSIQDSVRGVGSATKLSSNSTNAENNSAADATDPIYGYVTAINSNGFTAYAGTTPSQVNKSGQNYVAWQFQAGQGSTSSNTSGSITSTVSVNASAGFSIVTYTGTGANATVGHGLGVAPKLIILKNRSDAGGYNWRVWHTALSNTELLYLNTTDAKVTGATTTWNSTSPTSTVFSLGTNGGVNASTNTYVAYCWSEIAGFSKFGSYTGNGSADGSFNYTGFKPKFVMVKNANFAAPWVIFDSSRNPSNANTAQLYPNASDAETTGGAFDLLSNGFKIRSSAIGLNNNGDTVIYAAFSENPFKNALAR